MKLKEVKGLLSYQVAEECCWNPGWPRHFPELKDKNQDIKATIRGGRNGGEKTAKSRFLHCMKQKLTQSCLTLLRRFPSCLTSGQGRKCGQAQSGRPVNDSMQWVKDGHKVFDTLPISMKKWTLSPHPWNLSWPITALTNKIQ